MTTANRTALIERVRDGLRQTLAHGDETAVHMRSVRDAWHALHELDALTSASSAPTPGQEREGLIERWNTAVQDYAYGRGNVGTLMKYGSDLADTLEALSSSAPAETARMFPVQNGPDIPWSIIAPFEKQARKQHGGQTLERLAERHGLSVCEVLSILEGGGEFNAYWSQPGRNAKDTTANILRLCAIVAERSASPSQTPEARPADDPAAIIGGLLDQVDMHARDTEDPLLHDDVEAARSALKTLDAQRPKFSLGQAWVSKVTNASGPEVSVIGADISPSPCKARRCSTPEPQDCDWPFCGCDPHATKVIEALDESGMLRGKGEARPAGETPEARADGWRERIAAMDPWRGTSSPGMDYCFFCRAWRHQDHEADCLWQNAKDGSAEQ